MYDKRLDTSVSIVLVHGGFVDGSGWQGVYEALTKDGYRVSVVQNPTNSLADDVAVTTRAIAALEPPVVLVGHSYGGVVVTEAGNHPKVAALVYITAFAPDKGESVSSLDRESAAGRASAADSSAAGWVSVPRPDEVRRGVRRRPGHQDHRVHGRFAGPLGCWRAGGRGYAARVAQQAKLLPRRDGRPDDSGRRAALDG